MLKAGGEGHFTKTEARGSVKRVLFRIDDRGKILYFHWKPASQVNTLIKEFDIRVSRSNCNPSWRTRFADFIATFLSAKRS